jgi:hypothetical protein
MSCLVFPHEEECRAARCADFGAPTWRENARQGIHSGKKERGDSLSALSCYNSACDQFMISCWGLWADGHPPVHSMRSVNCMRNLESSRATRFRVNVRLHRGDVVQLVRMLPCHGRGRGFEPRRPRQILKDLLESGAQGKGLIRVR